MSVIVVWNWCLVLDLPYEVKYLMIIRPCQASIVARHLGSVISLYQPLTLAISIAAQFCNIANSSIDPTSLHADHTTFC